jgi:hypothetical protein
MRSPQIVKALVLSLAIILGAAVEKSFALSSPILLTIDDSNPSAVTITTTGFTPAVNDSTRPASSGVDLLGFFSANQSALFGQTLSGSTLSGGNSGVSYNDVRGDNFSTSGGNSLDLSLSVDSSSPGTGNTQIFSVAQPAFAGSWTIDLSDLGVNSSALPLLGTHGDILSGFNGDQGTIIGQWQVGPVPEPGMGSLFILSSVVAFVIKRRRD